MFVQQIAAQRLRRPIAVVLALALMTAVLLIATEAGSVSSSAGDPAVRRLPAQARPGLATSMYVSRRCWRRKFGCGQGGGRGHTGR